MTELNDIKKNINKLLSIANKHRNENKYTHFYNYMKVVRDIFLRLTRGCSYIHLYDKTKNTKTYFLVDTGAELSSISSKDATMFSNRSYDSPTKIIGVNKITKTYDKCCDMSFFCKDTSDKYIQCGLKKVVIGPDNILGQDFLKKYRVSISYENSDDITVLGRNIARTKIKKENLKLISKLISDALKEYSKNKEKKEEKAQT